MGRDLSVGEVAAFSGVSSYTVTKWCDEDMIEYYRTPQVTDCPGHRRIKPSVLFLFLQKHQLPIPAELCKLIPDEEV